MHVVPVDFSLYVLSEEQICNLASEFFGKELDRVKDGDNEKIEIGFESQGVQDEKKNAESFFECISCFLRPKVD